MLTLLVSMNPDASLTFASASTSAPSVTSIEAVETLA